MYSVEERTSTSTPACRGRNAENRRACGNSEDPPMRKDKESAHHTHTHLLCTEYPASLYTPTLIVPPLSCPRFSALLLLPLLLYFEFDRRLRPVLLMVVMAILPRASTTATTVLSSQLLSTTFRRSVIPTTRFFNSHPLKGAIAHPITAHGPPPKAPAPAPEFGDKQKQQQQQEQEQEQQQQQQHAESGSGQQEQLQQRQQNGSVNEAGNAGKETPAAPLKPSGLKKRFWKLVDVRKKQGMY